MVDFLRYGDGTGRPVRPIQVEALTWLAKNWDEHNVFAMRLDVGTGKTFIAEAVAKATRGHIINPTNLLLDQNALTYPQKNILKGKAHYNCISASITCEDWMNITEGQSCDGCPYRACREKAHFEPTLFNPMSYWFHALSEDYVAPRVIIVDEAHTLANSLHAVCGIVMSSDRYPFRDEFRDELKLLRWLEFHITSLGRLKKLYAGDKVKQAEVVYEMFKLGNVARGLRENSENYAVWTEDIDNGRRGKQRKVFKNLHIKPVKLLASVAKRVLNAEKIVLMSGTLFDADVKELVGDRPFLYKDFDSPIPVENRTLIYDPVAFPMNYLTDSTLIAAAIEETLDKYGPNLNTLVHVTYGLGKKLKPLFKRAVICNEKLDEKDECLTRFKTDGGVFVAAGCAEGIDLPGDQCRLNVIPKLMFPDLKDPVIAKRKALQDGDEWYAMSVFKTLIQQAGRSTRGADDHSVTVIRDPNFSRLFSKYRHMLPKSFREAIRWSSS